MFFNYINILGGRDFLILQALKLPDENLLNVKAIDQRGESKCNFTNQNHLKAYRLKENKNNHSLKETTIPIVLVGCIIHCSTPVGNSKLKEIFFFITLNLVFGRVPVGAF